MSSPEEPSKETTAPKAGPANEPEDSGTQPAAGTGTAPGTSTTGTGEDGAGASEQPPPSDAKSGEQGAGDQASDEAELPQLSPIPPSGTSAPADSGRVFGRTSSTFPQHPGGAPTPAGQGEGWQRTAMQQQAPTAEPTEDDLKKVRNRGRIALALGIMALLALLLFPLGLFLGIAAIVFGIIARRLGRRAGTVAAGAVPGIVLGIVSTMISLVIGVTVAVFWQEFTTYTTCTEGANTHTAQNKCRSELEDSLQERLLTETR